MVGGQRLHIELDVIVLADAVRKFVPVFEIPDVVHARDAVLQHRGVARHPALEVAAKQRVQIVLEEIALRLFFRRQDATPQFLLPARNPCAERHLHELQCQLLDVGKRRAREVSHEVRRHQEPPADFVDVEQPRLQHLRVGHAEPDLLVAQTVFEDRRFVRLLVRLLPVVPELIEVGVVLELLRMLQQVRDAPAVSEEAPHVALGRDSCANRLPRHRDDGEAANTGRADSADMKQVVGLVALDRVSLLRAVAVLHDIDQATLPPALAVGHDLRRQQRMHLERFAGTAAAEYLRVGITLQQAMAGESFAEGHRCHFVARRVSHGREHRVVNRRILDATFLLQHDQRNEASRFADDARAGPHHRMIQRGLKADNLARPCGHSAGKD